MNKMELISALKTEANLSKAEAARVVQSFSIIWRRDWRAENVLRSEGCAASTSRTTRATPAGTPKPVKKWQSILRGLPFFKAGQEIKERVDL